jgi:hypothetical protein
MLAHLPCPTSHRRARSNRGHPRKVFPGRDARPNSNQTALQADFFDLDLT